MITYNLNIDDQNHEVYYSTLKKLGKMIIDKDYSKSKKYIDEFKVYIQNFEELRDDKYYFIEIMLIGVLFYEYIDYTLNFKSYLSFVYNFLNKKRNSKFKSKIDIIRGKVNTSLYNAKNSKSNRKINSYNIDDFCKLIKWLDATYDFKDEVVRLKIWYEFLKTKSKDYVSFFFEFVLNHVQYMKKLGDENLIIYLPNLENYLNTYRKDHYNKEDIVYCGKGFVQYYFNMIFSEVMNDIFRDDFLNTDKKIVFLPACMTQDKTPCKCSNTSYGGRCNFCSSNCNVNKISKLGQKYNFKTRSKI